jgi:hypothetical protein
VPQGTKLTLKARQRAARASIRKTLFSENIYLTIEIPAVPNVRADGVKPFTGESLSLLKLANGSFAPRKMLASYAQWITTTALLFSLTFP